MTENEIAQALKDEKLERPPTGHRSVQTPKPSWESKMKFNTPLHAEWVLGTRQPSNDHEAFSALVAKKFTDAVNYCVDGWTWFNMSGDPLLTKEMVTGAPRRGKHPGGTHIAMRFAFEPLLAETNDSNLYGFWALAKKWKCDQGKAFVIGKDFAKALAKIDREVPMDHLPERFLGFFGFPPGAISDGAANVLGAYIFIGDEEETTLRPSGSNQRCVWIQYIDENNGIGTSRFRLDAKKVSELCADLVFDSGKKHSPQELEKLGIDKSFQDKYLRTPDSVISKGTENIARVLINAVLYLGSSDAEIRKLVGLQNPNLTNAQRKLQRKEQSEGGLENNLTIPVTFLNWGFIEKVRHIDETVVMGHFRWQRHGVGLKLIKLIWIDEHLRTFGGL